MGQPERFGAQEKAPPAAARGASSFLASVAPVVLGVRVAHVVIVIVRRAVFVVGGIADGAMVTLFVLCHVLSVSHFGLRVKDFVSAVLWNICAFPHFVRRQP
jgi:hypothetical protein